jgi:hypothetical protein
MFPQVPYSLTLTLDAHVVLLQPPTGPTAPVARVDTTLVQGVVRPPTPSDPETHSGEAPA